MNRFIAETTNRARGVARQQAGGVRFGEVTSVDPAACAVKVMLQPEGVLTGWLPVLSPWIGAGWGASCPPVAGDQVAVAFQEGDNEHGAVIGRAYSDAQRSPGAPSGELWLVHQSGSSIRLLNNGDVAITSHAHTAVTVGGNVTLTATGNVTATAAAFHLTGPTTITGDATIDGALTVTGDIIGATTTISLQHHKHLGVQPGSGLTGEPQP